MKLAYPIDTMLQVEVVGGAPSGAVAAVEPAQAREAWAAILESKRWIKIRAGYGRDPSGSIVGIQTNVEEIRPSEVVCWANVLIPGEPEPLSVLLGNAGDDLDTTWWIASLSRQDGTWIIKMFQLEALRVWEESGLDTIPGVDIQRLGAKAVVGPMLVTALAGVGRWHGDLGISVGLAGKSLPFLFAALVADSGLGWRVIVNASVEVQAAVLLFREEDPAPPVLGVAIGW